MKMTITKIHLGRYKIEMLDGKYNIIGGYDCGLAGLMVALTNWIFVEEHIAYQGNQRKSSDDLAEKAIQRMKSEAGVKVLEGKPDGL